MLNDTQVRNAKRADRPIKLSDSGGLHLLIQPNGSKLWRLAYRFGGKQKTLAIGVYPTVTLKHAREKRDEAKRLLADRIDPSTHRRLEKLTAASGNTFRAVAEEVLMKLEREGRADVTLAKKRWLLDFAYPAIGERPVAEIAASELLAVLRKVESRGRYETARRLRSTCGMVFRYAIATGRAERDPSVDLRGALTAPKVIHRATVVDPTGIGALLRAIEDRLQRETPEGQRSVHVFVSERLAPLSVSGYQRMVARAGEAAKFPFLISSHVLRHSCGYKLANDGQDTRAIQHYLGHRSIASTVRYTKLAPDRFKGFWKD
jgi:integrase